jgi:TPR repeat protein
MKKTLICLTLVLVLFIENVEAQNRINIRVPYLGDISIPIEKVQSGKSKPKRQQIIPQPPLQEQRENTVTTINSRKTMVGIQIFLNKKLLDEAMVTVIWQKDKRTKPVILGTGYTENGKVRIELPLTQEQKTSGLFNAKISWDVYSHTESMPDFPRSQNYAFMLSTPKLPVQSVVRNETTENISPPETPEVAEKPEIPNSPSVIVPEISPVTADGGTLNGNSYALLIGVDKYPGINNGQNDLQYAGNDMRALKNIFEKLGYKQIILMTDDAAPEFRPTKANIERQITEIATGLQQDDRFFAAFSGHGLMFEKECYLCPTDAAGNDETLIKTLVSRKWIYDLLDDNTRCQARHKVLLIDACRDKPFGRAMRGIGIVSDGHKHGFFILGSCSEGQRSYEHEMLQHGVFSYFMMQGLTGDADSNHDEKISVMEIFNYVSKRTPVFVKEEYKTSQTPELHGTFTNDFPLVQGKLSVMPLSGFNKDYEEFVKFELLGKLTNDAFFNSKSIKTIDAWKKGADSNIPEAMFLYSRCLANGYGNVTKDFAGAVEMCRKAAEQNCPAAQYRLGLLFQAGAKDKVVIPQNIEQSIFWLTKAAEAGYAPAYNQLGLHLHDGLSGKKDAKAAHSWFKKAMDGGSMAGQYNVGVNYKLGIPGFLPQDVNKAIELFRILAEKGYPLALKEMAYAYINGTGGLQKNEAEAFKYSLKSAEQGNESAQLLIGYFYETGTGVSKNPFEAFRWYQAAVEQEYAPAFVKLARCYHIGIGTEKSLIDAAKWSQKSADKNEPDGLGFLGYLYYQGHGVPQDLKKAKELLEQATALGCNEAKPILDIVEHDLRIEEMKESIDNQLETDKTLTPEQERILRAIRTL